MGNNELLLAISDIMDQKLDAVYDRMDRFDTKLDALDEKWRVRKNREFFKVKPDRALKCLREIAMLVQEEDNIMLGRDMKETALLAKTSETRKRNSSGFPKNGQWNGKTQFAKLIARKGYNEGAFGGILQYLSDKGAKSRRPCRKDSKWRRILEDAGVKFNAADFVVDWKHAKNPL